MKTLAEIKVQFKEGSTYEEITDGSNEFLNAIQSFIDGMLNDEDRYDRWPRTNYAILTAKVRMKD
jgi:hypothetical protein